MLFGKPSNGTVDCGACGATNFLHAKTCNKCGIENLLHHFDEEMLLKLPADNYDEEVIKMLDKKSVDYEKTINKIKTSSVKKNTSGKPVYEKNYMQEFFIFLGLVGWGLTFCGVMLMVDAFSNASFASPAYLRAIGLGRAELTLTLAPYMGSASVTLAGLFTVAFSVFGKLQIKNSKNISEILTNLSDNR